MCLRTIFFRIFCFTQYEARQKRIKAYFKVRRYNNYRNKSSAQSCAVAAYKNGVRRMWDEVFFTLETYWLLIKIEMSQWETSFEFRQISLLAQIKMKRNVKRKFGAYMGFMRENVGSHYSGIFGIRRKGKDEFNSKNSINFFSVFKNELMQLVKT